MVTLDARRLINTTLALIQFEQWLDQQPSMTLAHAQADSFQETMGSLVTDCEELRLPVAADGARGIKNAKSTGDLKRTLSFVRDAMAIGLNRRKFFEPEPSYLKYFENPKLFGDAVFAAFPSATDDIVEAGTCLALERSTACVMHLMRAAEVVLRALAAQVGVTHPQNDWGSYLREIDKELVAKSKAAGKHTPEEEFYAEAAVQIDHVKRAWRNKSMHVDKTYSQPRAEEILLATKSLMSHLAPRISE
ncbi:MAG TPA: hypothetical protein VMU67_16815 [Steroidobacteraceae bacterium]|nr:hypothetical protein [Steroidobacteraceae bacterium]